MAKRPLRTLILALTVLAAPAAAQEPIEVPSGQSLRFLEVIRDARGPAGLTYRFRFVAPEIARDGDGVDFETAAADMDFLCQDYALARVSGIGPKPRQIVISLYAEETAFGDAAPDVTKFFEAYRVVDDECVWEGF